MSTFLTEVRARRDAVWAESKALLDRAQQENRDLTAAEAAKYDENKVLLDQMRSRIDGLEERDETVRQAGKVLRELGIVGGRAPVADHEALDGLRSMALENNPAPVTVADPTPRAQHSPGIERRALSKTAPGNLEPVSFYGQIIESMVDASSVLDAGATVVTTPTGEQLRVPRATQMSSAGIVAEGTAIPEDDPTLGVVTLGAYKYGVLVRASREVIEDAGADLQAYLARETGQALGLALGAHLINGTGVDEPRGVLVDASVGVTGPDGTATSLGSQATEGQGTDLLNALYASVAEPYTRSPGAAFLLRGATLAAVRNLKASTGELVGNQYLAQAPARFLPDPFVPAMGPGAKSILFGDWSRYFVRVVNGVRFERSDEFAFDTDEVVFRAIIRADGALIDPSAVKVFTHSTV